MDSAITGRMNDHGYQGRICQLQTITLRIKMSYQNEYQLVIESNNICLRQEPVVQNVGIKFGHLAIQSIYAILKQNNCNITRQPLSLTRILIILFVNHFSFFCVSQFVFLHTIRALVRLHTILASASLYTIQVFALQHTSRVFVRQHQL